MFLKKHILLSLFFLFFVEATFGTLSTNIIVDVPKQVQIDSAKIVTVSPSKEKEDKLFADPKLKYKQTITAQKGMFERFLEWLAEKLFGSAGFENVITARQIIIWTIIIVAMGLLIWLLSKSDMVSLIKPKPKATAFNFIDVIEDLDKINFEEKIKMALADSDYRLATRWHYLKILFLMDRSKLIEFASYKTNIDYRYELKSKKHQHAFIRLSYIYEYVWYGKFVIGITDYKLKEAEFANFEKELNV
ncbi:MAG: hypothetical protein Q8L81_06315 [Bacteroidota bacterium]|nr:hypothetical protein [Bacteroidota bacterium]